MYLVACQREARERREKKKDRWMLLWAALAGGAVTAVISAAVSLFLFSHK